MDNLDNWLKEPVINEKALNGAKEKKIHTIGISNLGKLSKMNICVQFYDYDGIESDFLKDLWIIDKYFPYDMVILKTLHGFHCISFAILRGYKDCTTRAKECTLALGGQDYYTKTKNLVLRIGAKRENKKIISHKPYFYSFNTKYPDGLRISGAHFAVYKRILEFPPEVLNYYEETCTKKNTSVKLVHYYTNF